VRRLDVAHLSRDRPRVTFRSSHRHIVLVLALTTALAATLSGIDTARAAGCSTTSTAIATGLSASPGNTSNIVDAPHTVSASVTTDVADGSGICVRFSQFSGPSTGWPRYAVTNARGAASATWTSSRTGTDIVEVEALDSSGSVASSTSVSQSWTSKTTPSPTPTKTTTPRPTPTTSSTPSPSPSQTVPPTTPSATPTRTPTASPSPSPGPTPATPSPTARPVRSTAPDTAAGFGSGTVVLRDPSALPGGAAMVSGRSCPAGAPVTFSVDGHDAGTATATATGTFTGTAQLPDLAVGEYALKVTCAGRSGTVPIDLVVSSSSQPASGRGAAVAAVALLLGAASLGGRKDRRS